MTKDTVQALEDSIRQSKAIVDMNTSLERLYCNRDFRKVILDGYFRDEAVRLVHLKVDPAFQTPERQAAIVRQIDAIGALASYLQTLGHLAALAVKDIASSEATRDEILTEELQ